MIAAGIDAGSRTIKVVFLDATSEEVLAKGITDQGVDQEKRARDLFESLRQRAEAGISGPVKTVATGYGRNLVSFAETTVTEITCHARGVRSLLPETRTIVEIGGQDSKVIRLGPNGTVRDFSMNDRCAAGTGCFMEVVSKRLQMELELMGQAAAKSRDPAAISSMCVVFAENEIIGLLATGTPVEDIVAGVQAAMVRRISAMMGRHPESPIVFTGGCALIPGMADSLEAALEAPVTVSPHPQFTGAIGAALYAAEI